MATVLVTGATGAVGSAVVARLAAAGVPVRRMVRSRAHIDDAVADVTDAAAVAAACVGVTDAVHCAASISDDMALCRAVNVDGTRHVVDGLVAAGARRLVHISTESVYDLSGRTPGRGEIDETFPTAASPRFAYGRTKADAEPVVLAARARGLEVVILRPTIVLSMHPTSYWGPLAIARARAAQASGRPIYIGAELAYVHIDNLVDAIELARTAPAAACDGEAFNVNDGHGDPREYLAAVHEATGTAIPELPAVLPSTRIAGEKLRRTLGYAPRDLWRDFLRELATFGHLASV